MPGGAIKPDRTCSHFPVPTGRPKTGESVRYNGNLLDKHTNRRKFLIGGGFITAAVARRGIAQMAHMAPVQSAPPLLDREHLASFVDPLPVPVLAKPARRSHVPFYRIPIREFFSK